MIAAIAGLLACQLLGEILVRALMLPLPGPVAGMGLLFGVLLLHGRARRDAPVEGKPDDQVPVELGKVSDLLLRNLSLLFIPAAVGIVQYLGLLRTYAGPIAITIAVSTTLALIVTAVTFRLVARLHAVRHKPLTRDIDISIDERDHP